MFLFATWPFTNSCKIFYGIAMTTKSQKSCRTNSSLCYGKKDLDEVEMVFKIQFGHPLCENVTLKHLPSRDTKAFATTAQQR